MKKPSVAIIDVIGLTYDGTTLDTFGLGGSESAVIYMAKELAQIGFEVTVFNNCTDSRAAEGVYDSVRYIDLQQLHKPNNYVFDVMITSRTVLPFVPKKYWKDFTYPAHIYQQIKDNAKLKILWLHDTFCVGDQLLEELLMDGHIDEVFTLSDFHTAYFSNCDHGRKRNFEVLKNKIFMTRNGIKRHYTEVDITQKDENLFVYNASVTKGMLPLLEHIWPKVKKQIPEAKLTVIGGFYRFRDGAPPDAQEEKFHELVSRNELKTLDVTFTGVIPQKQIADIMMKSSFMIFPGAFPETFGISSLEALAYNTPLITTRFGALEETAVDLACYKLDYAIEPNSLFPNINLQEQVDKFVALTVSAYRNTYLHAQKMQYCNIVHEVCEWSTVALQWKQHIIKKLGMFLPVNEYRQVSKINQRVHEIFGRRFSNAEEWVSTPSYPQQHVVVISPFYNSEQYIEKCILSVASQNYDNYTHHLIDDCSTDNSFAIAQQTILQLPRELQQKFVLSQNSENRGAVYNHVSLIREQSDTSIVMLLDGDDSLMPRNDIFQFYNTLYDGTTEFSYGSCWSEVDNIPLIAQPYPTKIKATGEYRNYTFAWNMPYTHLRTFKKFLIDDIPDTLFQDASGNWFKAGGDGALFYALIEAADPAKVKCVTDIMYSYNDRNPLNDYKVNGEEQTRNAQTILTQKNTTMSYKKKILIAIPTAKYIESETFKSIYDLLVPEYADVSFQYFYGYNIDQVRNLIADWATRYDYLFSVDSDIVLPPDCLVKMLAHDVPMVSGVYMQRKSNVEIIEIYRKNATGGITNIAFSEIARPGLHEIDGCGFGCVLVKSEVIHAIGYPQFVYTSALSHVDTVSEDVDFCRKAQATGAKIYVDSSIVCNHIGTTIFRPKGV